ncbi:MAG: phosphoribosylanthranilate isomerase [Thermosediminibacterales bacterium]|nr:phosphoribosylanthranilate isomerase [Thermosediminibacterales bacterium]
MMRLTKVKVCGIRRPEDIEFANILNCDYVGFVFAKSPRQVTKEQVKQLCRGLDSSVKKVGVFVNSSLEDVRITAHICGLDIVQLHGEEPPDYCEALEEEVEVWKAVRIKDSESLKTMENFSVKTFLLDSYSLKQYGGSGKVFDWKLALEAKKFGNIVLAGGLNPENVAEAIEIVKPMAVDVSSGVETGGYKDFNKMKRFIEKVRESNVN